jgi:hypothetical protein
MFNKTFNLTAFIKNIRSLSIRRAAWSSMTSTLNYRLVSSADRIGQRLVDAGHSLDELKECSTREIKALICGPDTTDAELRALKKLYVLRSEYAELLAHATLVTTGEKDTDFASIQATLSFMTGPQRERIIKPENVAMARAAGFVLTDAHVSAAQRQMLSSDNHFAGMRAKRAGLTEWLVDQLFASSEITYDGDDDEMYSQLDVETKEWLANKFVTWCGAQLDRILMNTLTGRKGDNVLGIADKIILDDLVARLPDLIYKTATAKAVTKAKAAKPKADKAVKVKAVRKATKPVVQRAPRPTQATTTRETLPNGVTVIRNTETA